MYRDTLNNMWLILIKNIDKQKKTKYTIQVLCGE